MATKNEKLPHWKLDNEVAGVLEHFLSMEHEDNRPLEISFNKLIEKVERELAINGVKDASNYEIEWSLRRLMKETDGERKKNVRRFHLNTEEYALLN